VAQPWSTADLPAVPRIETEQTVSGKVATTLHGKRGEVNGALLENGTILRLPPPEAERMQSLLQPGTTVAARGAGLSTALGTVIDVRAIGSTPEQLTEFAPGPRPGPPFGGAGRIGPADFGPSPPPPRPPRG
jgi:hypothetical protein